VSTYQPFSHLSLKRPRIASSSIFSALLLSSGLINLGLPKCSVFYLVTRRTQLGCSTVTSLFKVGNILGSLLLFVWLLLLPLLGLVLFYYSLCHVALCLIKWRVLLLFRPCANLFMRILIHLDIRRMNLKSVRCVAPHEKVCLYHIGRVA
jgi:hypothetical protein